jgi:multisubunit Na+/H+ antiporter MnhG subunit
MSQIIFYTFSTIAQVLGAIIALLGVFVLFKIQNNNTILAGQAQVFYNKTKEIGLALFEKYLNKLNNSMIARNYPDVFIHMEETIEDINEKINNEKDRNMQSIKDSLKLKNSQLLIIKDIVKSIIGSDEKLKKSAICIAITSGINIILSVLILLFSNFLSQDTLICLTICLICLIVGFFVYNIIQSILLIRNSLKETYSES